MAAVGRGVDVAIAKAKEHGMSIVAVNNYSSATGALGVWAKKITSEGLIGIVLSQVC
jgi:LDH2 family malate/lactate/ureidoglycolate dehydrogenase